MKNVLFSKIINMLKHLILLGAGYVALPACWEYSSSHVISLGNWHYLIYFVCIIGGAAFIIGCLSFFFMYVTWIIQETLHILGFIWKSIVHLKIQRYTPLIVEKENNKIELKRRNEMYKSSIEKMTPEQRIEFEKGRNQTYDRYFERGKLRGQSHGFQDGYRDYGNKLEQYIQEIEEGNLHV